MRKNFNSVQMLETSENCDKYSKSVSYETLVGGTTTTGRERKQKESSLILRKAKFQAIFKFVLPLASKASSYKQPQNVVYNADGEVFLSRRRTTVKRGEIRKRVPEDKSCKLLSRLEGIKYNRISAFVSMLVLLIRRSLEFFRVPRKNREDSSFCFGFAKVPTLAFLLSLNLSTAFAEDCKCLWGGADGKTLTITGCPVISYSSCKNQQTANNVIIGTGVTSIDGYAFHSASSLTSITIPDSVTSIAMGAFQNTGLTSITIPDSVTYIGSNVFQDSSSLTSITIPDNIDTEGWRDYAFSPLLADTKFVCQGDLNKCYKKLEKYLTYCPQDLKDAGISCSCSSDYCIDSGLVKEATQEQCGGKYIWNENSTPKCRHMDKEECENSAQYYFNNGQCKSMPGSKTKCKNADFLWSESSCVKSCASGLVEWDKECLSEYPFAKKRWTPAEANEWLHDGNDNFVTITFKK